MPAGVDPEIIQMMLPTIKGDYEAFETYDMRKMDSATASGVAIEGGGVLAVDCPLTVFIAGADASVDAQWMAGWRENTTSAAYRTVEIPNGSHFYLTDVATKEVFYGRLIEEVELHLNSSNNDKATSADAEEATIWNCSLN